MEPQSSVSLSTLTSEKYHLHYLIRPVLLSYAKTKIVPTTATPDLPRHPLSGFLFQTGPTITQFAAKSSNISTLSTHVSTVSQILPWLHHSSDLRMHYLIKLHFVTHTNTDSRQFSSLCLKFACCAAVMISLLLLFNL